MSAPQAIVELVDRFDRYHEAYRSHQYNDVIWHVKPGELFPYRRQVEFLTDAIGDGRSLLKDLSYLTKKIPWALPLRNGYVEITRRDFDRIQSALGTQF